MGRREEVPEPVDDEHEPIEAPLPEHSAMDAIDTHRLEAFSDAVMAVIITLMALELKVPTTTTSRVWATARPACSSTS